MINNNKYVYQSVVTDWGDTTPTNARNNETPKNGSTAGGV